MAGADTADSEESAEKFGWKGECWAALLPFSTSSPANCQTEMAACDVIPPSSIFGDLFNAGTDCSGYTEYTAYATKNCDIEEENIISGQNAPIDNRGDNSVNPACKESTETEEPVFNGYELLSVKSFPPDEVFSNKKERKRKHKSRQSKLSGKRKWRHADLEDFGIRPSLFPRCQISPDTKAGKVSDATVSEEIEREFDEFEKKLSSAADVEYFYTFGVMEIRADRDRKIRKAHKQVKDKYCWNVRNNNGKHLYVHHRTFKQMDLQPQVARFLPRPKQESRIANTEQCRLNKNLCKGKTKNVPAAEDANKPTPPVATETRHALHSKNAPTALSEDQNLVNLLISLQHRDLSPEDYDILLRLDDQVAPKTVTKDILSSFKTDSASEADCCQQCAVCMENYAIGQMRKFLPCEHVFHAGCIDMWLENSSLNCPLDGLPVS